MRIHAISSPFAFATRRRASAQEPCGTRVAAPPPFEGALGTSLLGICKRSSLLARSEPRLAASMVIERTGAPLVTWRHHEVWGNQAE
jgi:hypothetical protein